MSATLHSKLLDKSLQAAVAAIEVYNKPDFKYREESFVVLMVNAWELLFKAKVLHDSNSGVRSLYVADRTTTKDGKPLKRFYPKLNRAGNPLTIDIFSAMRLCSDDKKLHENVELLVEVRDNAIHFMNSRHEFNKLVLELGTATLKSYVTLCGQWFNRSLEEFNFYLMPISFFHSFEMESFSINSKSKQQQNFLNYVSKKLADNPTDLDSPHNIVLKLSTKFDRSSSEEALKVKYDKDSKITVKQEIENYIENGLNNGTLFEYQDFVSKLKDQIKGFKQNPKFHKLKKQIPVEDKYIVKRYLNPVKKSGGSKTFYSQQAVDKMKELYGKRASK